MLLGTINLLTLGLQTYTQPTTIRVATVNYIDGTVGAQFRGRGSQRWRFSGNFPGEFTQRARAQAEWDKIDDNIGLLITLVSNEGNELAKGYISGDYVLDHQETVEGRSLLTDWRLQFTEAGEV